MLGYLINLSLPVLIYFISYLGIVFIQTFYRKKKTEVFRYFLILILATIFLEFLYRRNNKSFVWIIVLSPLLILGVLFILFIYMFFFFKRKDESYLDRVKSIQNIFNIVKKLSNIDMINQLKTFINLN